MQLLGKIIFSLFLLIFVVLIPSFGSLCYSEMIIFRYNNSEYKLHEYSPKYFLFKTHILENDILGYHDSNVDYIECNYPGEENIPYFLYRDVSLQDSIKLLGLSLGIIILFYLLYSFLQRKKNY